MDACWPCGGRAFGLSRPRGGGEWVRVGVAHMGCVSLDGVLHSGPRRVGAVVRAREDQGRYQPRRGRSGVRPALCRFLEDWFGAYEELDYELEEVSDLGNGVVFAVVIQDGRPVGSAGHLRQREGWVFVWVRGLIARLTTSEIDEARAAAKRLAEERA